MTWDDQPPLILASGSPTRRAMLEAAGIAFRVIPAEIDETAIREALMADDAAIDAADIADVLARAKAEEVSRAHPEALVIGSDQVLALDGEIFEKPKDIGAAREGLMKLRGQRHQLHSAIALAEDGEVTWSHTETAHLSMRKFSAQHLEHYLARAGGVVCESVGGYQIESLGVQLFDLVEGDHFTILGLPLLALLEELRERKVLVA